VELEAENAAPNRSWTPVVPVPSETVAVAMFQWKRLPISRQLLTRYITYALIIVLGCAALAYAVSALGAKSYAARTEIYYPLSANNPAGSSLRVDRGLSTQMVAMEGHAVLDPVAAKYHLTYDALAKKEIVTLLQDSEVIRIEVDDKSAVRARAIARDIAASYLKTQPNTEAQTQTFLNTQIAGVNRQLASLSAQFNSLEEQRQKSATIANPNPAETPAELSVAANVASLNNELTSLQSRLDAVTVGNLSTPHVSQLTKPYTLGSPVAPKPLRAALAGALAGIMVAAIVLAFLLRRHLKRQPLDQLD